MATTNRSATDDGTTLGIHLDIGHSSIGWAVTKSTVPVDFVGCGTVLFQKDGCLASARRQNRRQRRHIRSTRQRIARMALLLKHIGVLSEEELKRPGSACPWKWAAEALTGQKRLTWPELWDVLRWYAHNRGYDGNLLWQSDPTANEDDKELRESLGNAIALMEKHGTKSMAETVCAILGIAPGGKKCATTIRYKAAKASFPRKIVMDEVRRILNAHAVTLPGIDTPLTTALLATPTVDNRNAWHAIPCGDIKLPKRYVGGLLFGQLEPRFDNRIIGQCPVSGEKLPAKSSPEFLEYRWAMQLANIRVRRPMDSDFSALNPAERKEITATLREQGRFTKTMLKKAVEKATGSKDSNLEDMLLHPDAEEALILHPAQAEMNSNDAMAIRDALPKVVLQRLFKLLKKNRAVKLGTIRGWLTDTAEFDCAIGEIGAKMKKKDKDPLDKELKANYPSGRAPYARDVMRKVTAEVMAGQDPRSEGGTLYALHAEKKSLPESEIDQKTNNHLVRHRLRIMRRLIDEIVREYAKGDKARIDQVTIEVNRDVKELSGKTAKLIAQDMTTRLRSHKEAVEYASAQLEVPSHRLGGSFIRKVRIAMDTGWTCPYTGQEYDIHALRSRSVDLDHIIPRSKRTSDSLDSLVITFKAINAWKSNTTALEFVETQGGKAVPGMPNLSILSTQHYRELVETLGKKRVSHADDKHRRDNRCKRLLTRRADDKDVAGFTPRDLTVSSHLVKLALAVAADVFREEESPPDIRTIPGRITKEVRCSWNLLGHLATVNPQVISAEGELKTKTEIREVTHLHHAVDAMTIALARTLIPANGTIWELMIKRNLRPHEREQLEKTGAFVFDSDGRAHLRDLHEETLASLQSALAECRVATHIPAGKRGATLEKNAWGIIQRTKDMVEIRQQSRDEKTDVIIRKTDRVHVNKLLGITPRGTSKLQSLKGVIVISDNYGVALDPAPEVIPYHQVWRRLGVLKKKNGGVMPRILRKGMLIGVAKGRYAGLWKVCSIKNKQRDGILLEVSTPDGVASATEPRLLSLIRDGLEIHPVLYTGIPRCVTPCD